MEFIGHKLYHAFLQTTKQPDSIKCFTVIS